MGSSKPEKKKKKPAFDMPDFEKMDKKELTDYKWRLKSELKKVDARLKDIKAGKDPTKDQKQDDEKNPMPPCMKSCWQAFQECSYKGSMAGGQPSKNTMCACMPLLRDKSCNACD